MEVVAPEKFRDQKLTAKGETRASVGLRKLETLWFNTGTQCNLSCENCYIESNPKNDRLVYLSQEDVEPYLKEIKDLNLGTQEIGFTGGEPFINPHMIDLLKTSLAYGFRTLVLTNAYRLINRYKDQLTQLNDEFADQLVVRVSLDHHTKELHEKERGPGTFEPALKNIQWLSDKGFKLAIAGRSLASEDLKTARKCYDKLLKSYNVNLNADDPEELVIFPEMDPLKDVPEITTQCWSILNKKPSDIMCASSRMIVKRRGEDKAKVLACTLIAYDKEFELGETLKNSKKSVFLNHPFCAQFCVLGGASCS